MEVFGCSKYAGLVILFLFLFLLRCTIFKANAQQEGFLSIDCGGKRNHTDNETNITWVTDDYYMHNRGQTAESYYKNYVDFYLKRLRVFPKPVNKACYELPLTTEVPHLLRVSFVDANSSGSRGFNYSVETTDMLYMEKVVFDYGLIRIRSENILVSADRLVHICLIRTSECDDPFISAIELRPLKKGMYDMSKPGTMMSLIERDDMGDDENTNITRYPEDQFDRLWYPWWPEETIVVNVTNTTSISNTTNSIPANVMKSAVVASKRDSDRIDLSLGRSTTGKAVVLLYFAAFNSSETGSFSVRINNVIQNSSVVLKKVFSAIELAFPYDGTRGAIVSLQSDNSSQMPIINAVEAYSLVPTQNATFRNDVNAIIEVWKALSLNNWARDPCFGLPWEGIICSNINNTVRISQINLSERQLGGPIPSSFGRLTELVSISLSNNNFNGMLPDLTNLSKLETFGNKHLCRTKRACRNHFPTSVVGVAGGVLVIAILVGIVTYRIKFRSGCAQQGPLEYLMVNLPKSSKSRAFTLEEMTMATENFTRKIGEGSFGNVFLGELKDGNQIAVKVLSIFSKHGIAQFLNEVELLSSINHKKLVSFLGYCNESRDLMLVYEYMSGGSLSDNLYDPEAPKYSQLDWKTRLKIALDAAQGLEYLHVGCTPKIIHRDVKTSNILIDSNLNSKLADFGLSRVTGHGETSQINTTIKGTPGYLDPMYYKTHVLTDKSDVYSFGVVLLELISGRKPIDLKVSAEKILLTEWVASYVEVDKDVANIQEIVDRRLVNRYKMKSIFHLVNLAWRCIASEPSGRPTISEVVVEIREALAFEEERYQVPDELSLPSTSSFSSSL